MSKEIIIDFCKTDVDAKIVLEKRKQDYILSFKLNDVELIDQYLAKGSIQTLLGTSPDINDSATYFQIQVWTLKT